MPEPTRVIAQTAVRNSLVQATLDLVSERGYENVTLEDLAAATGVSRSTYLRHVGSKADAVVEGLMNVGDRVADRLRERPHDEDTWTALRRSLDDVVEAQSGASERALDLLATTWTSPSLSAAMWLRRTSWRSALAAALAEREPHLTLLASHTAAAAALGCLDVALELWSASHPHTPFSEVLDEAFRAITLT
ncbi:TetR/AcrR family transcriptional regulator [Agromyces mangrovi Wang et al. 2018]|uniref:TetR/AcrR family transcriptional regulator n=1 Tax=Agromyces mangrovi TaxID=1858653 RepID=UPI0025732B6B|nr:TetR/AcrR family transcriptional regulator [Agromyces mangrovi]BDZ65075.1 TetR family transcriptional regulator [Agromyces mangrovi]